MGPAQSQWPNYEEKPRVQAESNHSINTTMQVRSNFFQCKKKTRNCLLPTPRLLETFLQNSQLSIISELLRTNCTTVQLYFCQDWLGFRNPTLPPAMNLCCYVLQTCYLGCFNPPLEVMGCRW